MRRRPVFAQILDEKLCASERSDSRQPQPPSGSPRIAPAPPLLFAATHRRFNAAAYSAQVECASTPHRTLAAHEKRALSALNRLGARLTPDFTAVELRRAFRGLARQYHPDRQPLSDSAAQAQMARLFGEIVAHHRELKAAACPG